MATGPVPQRWLASLRAATNSDSPHRRAIPRRPRVSPWLALIIAIGFASLVTPAITADRWITAIGVAQLRVGEPAPASIRVPPLAGMQTAEGRLGHGGLVIARGEIASEADVRNAAAVHAALPGGTLPYVALFVLTFVLGAIFAYHMGRSTRGRLVRVQIVSLAAIALVAIGVKIMLLTTALSVLIVPVGVLALLGTMALDRVVGLATGVLAALVVALMGPFDLGVAIVLLVQAGVAGLLVPERPKDRWRAVLTAGAVTTLFTAATYLLSTYLTTGTLPDLADPLHSPWFAAALGPAIATVLAVPLLPLYEVLTGEITRGKLIELEDLSNPLLKQIAERSPGTWQHSLMMANLAEIAANEIGASGRLVRVGAYYHDLGKSLQAKYFIENLEPGETSPHDKLPPEVSCDAIFAHVTEGIAAARKAGLHERIIDFMHMHHGNGVLEYFWGRCKDQGNPHGLSIEQFRYPGHPPQSRETAILAICDAVEAASRTLKKPDAASIDSLVQRIVYGKLHLRQLDESGLSMGDLRRVADSLRETIRHANHGRIEYPWQKAEQDASASLSAADTSTSPRLDSLDRSPAERESSIKAAERASQSSGSMTPAEVGLAATADLRSGGHDDGDPAIVATAPATAAAAASAPHASATNPAPAAADPVPRPSGQLGDNPPSVELIIEPSPFATAEPSRRRGSSSPFDPSHARPPTHPPFPDKLAAPEEHDPHDARSRPRSSAPPLRLPTTPPPGLDGVISAANLVDGAPARKRAATLPPTPVTRAPSVSAPNRGRRSAAPATLPSTRTAGPPGPVDLENAVTNPPPLRAALLIIDEQLDPAAAADAEDGSITGEHARVAPSGDSSETSPAMPRVEDAASTEPSLPRFELPLRAPAASLTGVDAAPPESRRPRHSPPPAAPDGEREERDEWSLETPVIAPSPAELRSLLGSPDPTRQVPLAEIEELHRRATDEETSEPDILQRRIAPSTTEVDPDDIEAAIELAPPARRRPREGRSGAAGAIAAAKPKKPG